ncbi:HNH endonuclease signature motif containing protein [Streptomyces sp. NPDC057217]|uniref:HNH endonuclease signature motif containing protein n=1 Tax=Streptomyces sp. NPDC057217 TaxID=3346054 RepID=UPI0036424CCF
MPRRAPLLTRFWSKVDLPAAPDGCAVWRGARTRDGYGSFWDGKRVSLAHRVSYEALEAEIPPGKVLDHLCRNPSCVRPDHLQPVTQLENMRRGIVGWNSAAKTHCPAGHAYTDENTRRYAGRRHCRACDRARQAARRLDRLKEESE